MSGTSKAFSATLEAFAPSELIDSTCPRTPGLSLTPRAVGVVGFADGANRPGFAQPFQASRISSPWRSMARPCESPNPLRHVPTTSLGCATAVAFPWPHSGGLLRRAYKPSLSAPVRRVCEKPRTESFAAVHAVSSIPSDGCWSFTAPVRHPRSPEMANGRDVTRLGGAWLQIRALAECVAADDVGCAEP
jgi:hypothetical protein